MRGKVRKVDPAYDRYEPVSTPKGKGRVVALAQTQDGWRYRVALAKGGHWTGPESKLSPAKAEGKGAGGAGAG
jgi:hypothetical protein